MYDTLRKIENPKTGNEFVVIAENDDLELGLRATAGEEWHKVTVRLRVQPKDPDMELSPDDWAGKIPSSFLNGCKRTPTYISSAFCILVANAESTVPTVEEFSNHVSTHDIGSALAKILSLEGTLTYLVPNEQVLALLVEAFTVDRALFSAKSSKGEYSHQKSLYLNTSCAEQQAQKKQKPAKSKVVDI